jgi:molecular chaperone GrpE
LAEGDEVVETGTEQAQDIEALQQALAQEKEKAERYLANWQRSQADFQNFARRTDQEKSETVEFANKMLILNLLPILDDFERALVALPVELDGQSWTDGIKIIYNKLKTVLEAQGLAEIRAKGECFDPYCHEAAVQVEGEEGIIVGELCKGYKFKGRLLRPSIVMVGRAKENKDKEERSQED